MRNSRRQWNLRSQERRVLMKCSSDTSQIDQEIKCLLPLVARVFVFSIHNLNKIVRAEAKLELT